MKIKSVELKNVKCYENEKFDFEKGINFISGMNGAGKTSIIESIGFALFDCKVGKTGFSNYFIRKGEKKAIVRIIFEDKNKKEYIVERKITYNYVNSSWIIKDIATEEEIVSGEVDVINWLKDHLGFYRDDNISEMYENIISVPQGMFTSAFLETTQTRKNKFDPIFNLEIYRAVFKNTASLESGLKNKKAVNETELEKLNVKIGMLANDKKEYGELKKEIVLIKKVKKEKEKEYNDLDKLYQEKNNVKNDIAKLKEKTKIDNIKIENVNKSIENFNKELKISNEAKSVIEKNKQYYETYIKEEEKQKNLKSKKKEFDLLNENQKNLLMSIDGINKIIVVKKERKEELKENINIIKKEIKDNESKIQGEDKILNEKLIILEEEKRDLEDLKQRENVLDENKKIIEKNKVMIQEAQKNVDRLIKLTKNENELLEQKKVLEKQIQNKEKNERYKNEIEEALNELLAKLEHLKESKKIAKDRICPYLKAECINVKGKTQQEYNEEIGKLNEEINILRQEKKQIEKQAKVIIESETELKNIISKMQEIKTTKQEIDKVQKEITELQRISKDSENKIYQILELYKIEKSLENLKEFKILIQKKQETFNEKDKQYNILKTNLENTKKEQSTKEKDLEKVNTSIKKIDNEIQEENKKVDEYNEKILELKQKLEKYITVEKEIEDNEKRLQEMRTAYDVYMQNIEIAKKAEMLETSLENCIKELEELKASIKNNDKLLKKLYENYDEAIYIKLEQDRSTVLVNLAEINTKMETRDARLRVLQEHMEDLKQTQEEQKEVAKKIVLYQKAIEYLTKIRQIVKQAPEDISEILIQKVSRKANEMYSKIANDNTRLEWREGYEVILVDSIDGRKVEKEFRQLSGGEQMSAALAIRISMLEILTSLQIGILDEPTVNMDVGRRERLAEIIESIGKFFNQLFVVSHDDTFHSITENTIQL